MRLIVRFRSEEDLQVIAKKCGLKLDYTSSEVIYSTKSVKYKNKNKPVVMRKTQWEKEWVDMPEFITEFLEDVYAKIDFYFEDPIDYDLIANIFEQEITHRTTSIWYPKLERGKTRDLRVIGGENPVYPVYIVSKGRWENCTWHTSYRFSQSGIPHYLVVEPDEYDLYKQNFNNEYVTILKLDMKYKDEYDCFSDLGNVNSTGPGAARNFCWEHSIKNGFKWHWVFDDNIDGFDRTWRGRRLLVRTGECLRSCERFVDRYENIAIAGINYASFCKSGDIVPPYVLNTRIYSMLLIRNDIPYRWRGRYNEDTDLSLRVLKDGWCTVQFNLFLGEKITTQKKQGGNTREFYKEEGTKPKSQMLVDMHPDVVRLVYKFHRWHHEVNYSVFKQQLKMKENESHLAKVNEFGMRIVKVPKDIHNTEKDTRDYIEKHYDYEENRVDNTDLYLGNLERKSRSRQRKLF